MSSSVGTAWVAVNRVSASLVSPPVVARPSHLRASTLGPVRPCETVIVGCGRRLTTSGRRESMAPLFGMGVGWSGGGRAGDAHAAHQMTGSFVNPSWMPHSVSEAAKAGDATADDLLSRAARGRICSTRWARRPRSSARTRSARNAADLAAGFRHLLVLLSLGADQALRAESDPVLAVSPSGVDNVYKWGMDCPDCIYTGAPLRGGESYRIWGNRGSARYVGLQSMAGMASSANVLLDELDLGPGGEVELTSRPSATRATGCRSPRTPRILVVRHFFYDWDTEVASSLSIERIGGGTPGGPAGAAAGRPAGGGGAPADRARRLRGRPTSSSSSSSPGPRRRTRFLPPLDGTAMGAAAENRPVIGSFELGPDEALVVEVTPPDGPLLELLAGEPVVGDRSTTPATRAASTGTRRWSTTTASSASSSRTRTPASPTGSTPPGTAPAR